MPLLVGVWVAWAPLGARRGRAEPAKPPTTSSLGAAAVAPLDAGPSPDTGLTANASADSGPPPSAPSRPPLPEEDLRVIRNLELLRQLELLEAWEVLVTDEDDTRQ